jgi:hypothetical protein
MSETTAPGLDNAVIAYFHQIGFKIYNCEGYLCLTKNCDLRREITEGSGGGIELLEGYSEDMNNVLIPGRKIPYNITYADGTKEFIKEFKGVKKGCEKN